MTDRDSFIRAINAAPKDDAPLLVYADWLDEHGGEQLASRIRCATARLSDEQWGLIGEAVGEMVYKENGNGNVRISIGGFSYFLDIASPGQARQRIVAELKKQAENRRRHIVFEIGKDYRYACCRRWDRVLIKIFGTQYIYKPIANVIKRKIRERTTLKAIGVPDATSLSTNIDDIILNQLCGCNDWRDHDPRLVADLERRLKEAINGFDPWAFDWSPCRLQPKVRRSMQAAGFIFSKAV